MANDAGVTEGSQGYVGVMTQSIPGGTGDLLTPVAATTDHFLPIDAPTTLASKFEKATNDVAMNSPDTNRSQKNTKAKVGGTLTYPLTLDYHELAIAALGMDAWLAAVTADTIATITANSPVAGQTSLVLTTGGGSYVPGATVKIDASTLLEYMPIISWTPGTKTLVVPNLKKTHGSTPAIQQIGIHKASPIVSTGGQGNLRRTCTIEENTGDEWAEQYPAAYVDKWALKGAKDKIQATAQVMCDADRIEMTTPTAFAQTAQTDLNLKNPYTFADGWLVLPEDPTASGTSTLQQAALAQDWSFSLDNKCNQEALDDGQPFFRVWPGGKREIKVDFTIIQQAARNAAFRDFVKGNNEAAFFAYRYQVIAGAFYGFCVYVPNLHFDDAETIRAFDKPVAEKVMCTARANGSNDVAQFFIASSLTGSAY